MKTAVYSSPIGEITLAVDNGALIGLWFKGQKFDCAGLYDAPECEGDAPMLKKAELWLDEYFSGRIPEAELKVSPRGTEFQKKVWQALTEIPYGQTASYGSIAKDINCRSARAVGSAVGRNPVSIIIPCHRVIGTDGSVTGYAGGIERKIYLLELEKSKTIN